MGAHLAWGGGLRCVPRRCRGVTPRCPSLIFLIAGLRSRCGPWLAGTTSLLLPRVPRRVFWLRGRLTRLTRCPRRGRCLVRRLCCRCRLARPSALALPLGRDLCRSRTRPLWATPPRFCHPNFSASTAAIATSIAPVFVSTNAASVGYLPAAEAHSVSPRGGRWLRWKGPGIPPNIQQFLGFT